MKKAVIAIMAAAFAGAFATSPQIQNTNKVYDILGRKSDKVTAQRVIANTPKAKSSLIEDNQQFSSISSAKRTALMLRAADENTLAVGQDINSSFELLAGPFATPKAARKDTKLVFLGWGKHSKDRGWDIPHTDRTQWDDEEAYRCWIVAAQILNHTYMKKMGKSMTESTVSTKLLTQDEIKYHVFHNKMDKTNYTPENDFPFAGRGSGTNEDIVEAMNFALGTTDSKFYGSFRSDDYKEWSKTHNVEAQVTRTLAYGNPVIIGEDEHVMIVDAYAKDSKGAIWIRLLNPNNNGSFQWRNIKSVNFSGIGLVAYSQINPPYSDKRIHMDSDGDGLMDFDEEERFKTNFKNKSYDWDTDGDGVSDKDEILAYTLRHIPDYTLPVGGANDPSEQPYNMWNHVFITSSGNNEWADANLNGVRAEKDPTEQGSNTFDPRPVYATDDTPRGFHIYALGNINVGKNVTLGTVTMGSEKSSTGTTITVSAKDGPVTLYTQGGVVFNGGAEINTLEKFSDRNIGVSLSNGSTIKRFQDSNPRKNWAWQVKTDLPPISCGVTESVIKPGKTFTLKNGEMRKSLRVMDGATLVLEPGEMYIKNLILNEGAKVKYSNSMTTLHIQGTVTWAASNSTDLSETRKSNAKNLKLIHHGTSTLTITSGWYGNIYAPNADLKLGSNGGHIYGHIVGKNIDIAEGTSYNSSFISR